MRPGPALFAALIRRLALCGCWCLVAATAQAHEVRPAYLALTEQSAGVFSVLWKTPMRGEARLSLSPAFSGPTQVRGPMTARTANGASIQQWTLGAGQLRGQQLVLEGLESTMTDALVRIDFADGSTWTQRLTPRAPSTVIPHQQTGWSVAWQYLQLGVEHILLGIDHLLFVLALLLVTAGGAQLVKTITAFTVAHSITLGLAALGMVRVPSAPIEAVIALSIVFVAAEILRAQAGKPGLASRAPWFIAFAFGLLHGFGFAGALSGIGLPPAHIPTALLFFNVGVEIGQLLFVGGVLALVRLLRGLRLPAPRVAALSPAYAIGGVAMFWVMQRVAAF
jgi:hydrogenase/urease accessory protein HupE